MSHLVFVLFFATALLSAPAFAEEGASPPDAVTEDKAEAAAEAEDAAHERELRRAELYGRRDYRIADPGARPVSNFYGIPGFREVDPRCYAGVLTWEAASWHPIMAGSKFHIFEQIRIRPRSTGGRYRQRHSWELWSDPFELMGVVSTSSGSGGGSARVRLEVSLDYGIYRLVTDVRPREGAYQISTTGPGISRTVTEDFFFYYGDHHYSYVDLSGLAGAGGIAMAEIDTLLSTRPPNVHMGYFEMAYDAEGVSEGEFQIDETERIGMAWGVKVEGERSVSLRIFCEDLLRQEERRWGE